MKLLPVPWPVLLLACVLAIAITVLYYLWDTRRKRQLRLDRSRRVAAGPGDHTVPLLLAGSMPAAPVHPPLLLIVAIGTMGVSRALATLRLMLTSGLDHLVGAVFIVEHDVGVRAEFEQALPAVYRDGRVVYAAAEDFSGGFANKPVSWVLDHSDEWAEPVQSATRELTDTFLRRSENRAPALITVFTSLGGQAPAGIVVLSELAARFGDGETTLICAATALPRHERLRQRWLELKPAYERHGVAGWLVIDNLIGSEVTSVDSAVVMLLVGHLAAAMSADQPTAANNVLALACTESPGAVLVIEVVTSSLVAFAFQPDPAQPSTYYVQRRPLVVQIHRALRALVAGRGVWSADLPTAEIGTSTFDLVVLPLTPDPLQRVRDEVEAGAIIRAQLAPHQGGRGTSVQSTAANAELAFAGLATHIDSDKPVCPIVCIRLQAVRDGASRVSEIVKIPAARRLRGARSGNDGNPLALPEYVPDEERSPSNGSATPHR